MTEPRPQPPWHTIPADDVAQALAVGPHGLTSGEAARRLAVHGPNVIDPVPPPPWYTTLLHQFTSPVIYILLLATLVTLLLQEWLDAAVIAAVLALNATIGFTQERRAERSVRALMSLIAPRARVIRDGHERDIESRDLVPGDLVLLESGMRVPADIRLAAVNALVVDQSLLTGESEGVSKSQEPLPDPATPLADRTSMAYSGTVVVRGRARGYVVATGMQTELGAIAGSMRAQDLPTTPLQDRMERFARTIGLVVAVGAAASFALGVLVGEAPSQMFLVAVALAVAVVPEGLPIAFTIALALGVRRMARRNAIIRKLPAVETLGSTTVIGSDKTGTLTENRMTVRELWTPAGTRPLSWPATGQPPQLSEPERLLLVAGVMTNEADAYLTDNGYETSGDPTEAALLLAAIAAGLEPADLRAATTFADIPFESERQYSATCRQYQNRPIWFVKGAPERITERSTTQLSPDGEVPIDREAVLAAAHQLAGRGYRVLAMAYRPLDTPPDPDDHPRALILLGLQAMMDPPRPGVRDAIAGCQQAGMRVIMITGDHATTASAIAAELGIAAPGAPVLPGPEIDTLPDETLQARLREVSVIARAAPEHKLRAVEALRADGHVVAVTGDGVNDAPALRAADIGIAMGRSGTDVAREAADMVLADDNFVTIYAAVEEGRVTFENVRKVTFFLVSTGAALLLAILASVLLQWPVPMVAAQFLWLNLVTNGLQDVALAFEPGEKDVLRYPPRPRTEGIISPLLWERTVVAGAVMCVGTLALFRWELDQGATLEAARTVALTTMVLFQAFHLGNARVERQSAFARSPLRNPFLFYATVAALAIHIASLYLPLTQYVLRVEPLPLEAWLRMLPVAATVIIAVELHKLLVRSGRPLHQRLPRPSQ